MPLYKLQILVKDADGQIEKLEVTGTNNSKPRVGSTARLVDGRSGMVASAKRIRHPERLNPFNVYTKTVTNIRA